MHDTLTIGIPVFVILMGILLNRQDVSRLEGGLDARFDRLEGRSDRLGGRMDRLETDLKEFFKIQHETDKRLERK